MDYNTMEPTERKFLFFLLNHPCLPVNELPKMLGNDVKYSTQRLTESGFIELVSNNEGSYYRITDLGAHTLKNFIIMENERKEHLKHNWKVGIVSAVVGAIVGGITGFLATLISGLLIIC